MSTMTCKCTGACVYILLNMLEYIAHVKIQNKASTLMANMPIYYTSTDMFDIKQTHILS